MTGELVRDAPEAYYARWALSNSGMGELLRCPARLKALLDRAGERDADTPAMLTGRLLHCMVLEPEALAARWRRKNFSGTTKEGRAESAAARADGVTLVPAPTWDDCEAMRAALMTHPAIGNARHRETEVSVYWEERDGLVPCKARVDMLAEIPGFGPVAIDLKTTCDASPRELERGLLRFGYARQAAWYLRGLRAAGRDVRAFVFVAVEKTAPHVVTAYTVSADARERALRDIERCVETFAQCTARGQWPGYTESPIVELDLPAWAYRQEEDD